MLNWLKRSLGALLAVCMLVSMLPTALAADRSEIEGHWAKEPLTYFADKEWMVGDERGYRPDDVITRAEFMTLLNKVCGYTQRDDAAAKKFKDVPENQWYFSQVSIALAAGYVAGNGNGTMTPEASITREEAFSMIARIAELSTDDMTYLNRFKDAASTSGWAKSALAALAQRGYISGYEDGSLHPQWNITRAEAVQAIYATLDQLTVRYVLMNIPYDDFYAAELNNDVAVDGVTSATLNKTRTQRMAAGSYHVNADGSDISGIIFPVKVPKGVRLDGYTQITDDSEVTITVTNRGTTTPTTYTGKDALFESMHYSYYLLTDVPTCYKEITEQLEGGNLVFSEIQGAQTQKLDVTAELTTKTNYGDYQVNVNMDDDAVDSLGTVYGIVFTTKEGNDYAMRHLENIWFGTEIAWCTGFTTTVHGCPTSSDHYVAMMGQTINKITYITSTGLYTIDTELYVPVKTETKLEVESVLASAGKAEITEELPDDYQPLYTVTNAKGEEVEMEVDDGYLLWTEAAIGSYTLTVTDSAGKYAPVSASFVLSTEAMPAQAAEDNQSIVKTEEATEEEFTAFLSAITKVNVNGKDYAASGRGSVKVIKADGTIDFTTAPFKESAVDGKYVLTITATGYENTLTVTVPETYYLYASLTYEEYWAAEGVYAADNTDSSEETDSRGEYDKGGYDAVARATSNHGLHRGSFQQDVTVHTESGEYYYPLYWTDGNNFVNREDGQTYNKSEIGITGYEITGIKYVPVAVRAQDYAQFVKDFVVTLNGETLYGGYSEKNLAAYTNLVAEVTANTNGLKVATLTDGVWSFGARQTGTDSGIQDQDLTVAVGAEGVVKTYSGNFGEFLRYDINGDYGGLGSAMQTVKWTYYGTDSTYTTPVATYGTKFAADNWMHKLMGIQLGLTDSIRCQLPEGTDGTGYWAITVYGLGYADYTAQFVVTAENLPTKVAPMTDEQKTQLTALKDEAAEILGQYDDETIAATPALAALKEHYGEAVAMLADADATEPEAAELLSELPSLIEAAKALTPAAETYTGTAEVDPSVASDYDADDPDFEAYSLTANFTLEGGKIKAVATTITSTEKKDVKYSTQATTALNTALSGKTLEEAASTDVTTVDGVSGATCSSKAIIEALKTAEKAS